MLRPFGALAESAPSPEGVRGGSFEGSSEVPFNNRACYFGFLKECFQSQFGYCVMYRSSYGTDFDGSEVASPLIPNADLIEFFK